ncbi:MAG: hypothetical protein AAGD43_16330 [Pseudomonadota bacterium]
MTLDEIKKHNFEMMRQGRAVIVTEAKGGGFNVVFWDENNVSPPTQTITVASMLETVEEYSVRMRTKPVEPVADEGVEITDPDELVKAFK